MKKKKYHNTYSGITNLDNLDKENFQSTLWKEKIHGLSANDYQIYVLLQKQFI